MSESSPFRTAGDRAYRWPPEPAEAEREYVRVTKLISQGEPQPWMKPWVSKLIVDEVLSNLTLEPDQVWIEAHGGFAIEPWWREQLQDARVYDERHVLRGVEQGRNNKAWKYESLSAMTTEERVARYLKEAPDRKRDKAAAKGTEVHKLAENIAASRGVIVPDELAPYVANFNKFREDFPITYTEIEATVYSDTYGYAGQVDAFATYEGKNICLDYKTGDKGIKTSIALQLAAYAGADYLGRVDGTKDPIPTFDEFWGVSITDKGYEVIPVVVNDETWNHFLAVRETALWMQKKKSEVLGRALKPAEKAA